MIPLISIVGRPNVGKSTLFNRLLGRRKSIVFSQPGSTRDIIKERIEINGKIFFLIGADNLKSFHKWKNWEKIPRMAKIVIFPRKGYSHSSFMRKNLSKKDIIFIKSKKVDISSSLIRKFW